MCLFCLYAAVKNEIHACSNKREKGLVFADDATFALDWTFNSFQELIDVLEAFKF